MAGSASKDMTQGSPTKLIFAFFVPLMLGMLFQQFYSMMDTMGLRFRWHSVLARKIMRSLGSMWQTVFFLLQYLQAL